MAKKEQGDPLGGDIDLGVEDVDGPVSIVKTSDGRAVIVPGPRIPKGEALEVVADVQGVVRRIKKDRAALDELVTEARALGVSWALLGFSTGLTVEGARKRWMP